MPELPHRISRLTELAYDLWWTWTGEARQVFRSLDYPLWRLTAHNPVRMLQLISPHTLDAVVHEPGVAGQVRPGDRPAGRRAVLVARHLVLT